MTTNEVERLEDKLIECLGETELLNSIIKALDIDTKADIYEYIARCYDVSVDED